METATEVRVQVELRAQYDWTPMNALFVFFRVFMQLRLPDDRGGRGNGFAEAVRYVIGMVLVFPVLTSV